MVTFTVRARFKDIRGTHDVPCERPSEALAMLNLIMSSREAEEIWIETSDGFMMTYHWRDEPFKVVNHIV